MSSAGQAAIESRSQRPGAAFAILLALWNGATSATFAFALWFGEQLMGLSGHNSWQSTWVVGGIMLALAIGLPAWLARWLSIIPRYRAVFGVWLLAAGFTLCLLPARMAGPSDGQMAAALQIAGLVLYFVLLAAARRGAGYPPQPGSIPGIAVAIPALLALPWAVWGALGSPLDTAINLVAALLFGLAVALTLEHRLLPLLRDDAAASGPEAPRHHARLAGLAAFGALPVMGVAFGVNGQQLVLVMLLPWLAWIAARLGLRHGWRAASVFIGLATAAPLLFFDPYELNLVLNLGGRDVGYYVFIATVTGAVGGMALGLAALAGLRPPGPRAGALVTLLAVVALVMVYAAAGQTGWHGERLFVILRDQADVSGAAVIADPVERRAVVYQLLTHHADATQTDLRRAFERLGVDYTPYYLANALEVDGGPLWRWWLVRRPEVDRVLTSPTLRPLAQTPVAAADDTAPPAAPLWSQTLIDAPAVWAETGITGAGIVIGQSDSGADGQHPELRDQYRGNTPAGPSGDDYNWLDPWNGTTTPTDTGGHGTHTLATTVGGSVGVAPGSTWIGCVNLARNLGNAPRYLDCLQFLLAPFPQGGNALVDGRPELGAHVLNNSWGCPPLEGCDPGALLDAVRALRAAGLFVVASAGNDGPSCSSVSSPLALYDEVFTVGAVDASGQPAYFSSRGPVASDGSFRVKPDIAAPGVGVTSAVPGGGYAENDGTSMAGPHVAGVVALLWSANPSLIGDIDRTERILTQTAAQTTIARADVPECGDSSVWPNNFVGYGIVNALAAVQMALAEP